MSRIKRSPDWGEEESALGFPVSELDERLESAAQRKISRIVKGLPADEPSLVWRSQLNERLESTAKKGRARQRLLRIWSPALGLGLAAAIAVVMMVPRPVTAPVAQKGHGIEAALVATHQDTVLQDDIAGIGLTPMDVEDAAKGQDAAGGDNL